ncbi:MAG: ankyrin repeat domain-containing protein, partial [Allobaculum sp.]|nr:ankyrin repeat domain-containing protein [Allobaculum sp.]
GYKVFFARITLEDKLGSAYESYIFAALNSARIMLIVGTKPEHFNAVWVKNEWSRYLAMIESGQKKHIIPCYRDMSPYDMPEQFSSLQAQDVSKLGYMQDLLRGLAKIMNEAHSESAHTQSSAPSEQNKMQNIIKLAFLDYENNNISNAQSLFREALQLDSECLEAYFGLILSVEQNGSYVKTLMQLSPEPNNFEKRYIADNYEKCFLIFAKSSFTSRLKYLLSIHPEILTKNYRLTDSQYADTESCPIVNYVILELNNAVILRNILEVGAEPNSERIKKNKGVTEKRCALDDAICCAENAEMVELLLKYKADPNRITENYYNEYDCPPVKIPILSRAVCDTKNNKAEIVRLLLENGANPNTCRVYIDEFNKLQYYSVLSDSIWNAKNLDVLKLLLKHGADPNKITIENTETDNPTFYPLLNQAIYQNNYEMVKALLENGADPNGCRKFRNRDLDVTYSALGDAIW